MESQENRRKRRLFAITCAIAELNRVLESSEYNPDSATLEEQVVAGCLAALALIKRDLEFPRQ